MMINIAKFIRWIGVLLLGVMVLVTPWCLGSIYVSVQVWLFPIVMLSLICALAVLLLDRKTHFRFPVLLIPILLILLLIGLQLRLHDHASLVKRSPKAVELRELLLPARDSAEYRFTQEIFLESQASGDPATKSIYPAVTRHQLSLFVLVISAFYSTLVLFQHRIVIIAFAVIASINGCALALLGIFMRLNPHLAKLFFYENMQYSFSTFLNKNNAAGYLGMCLGAVVILMLYFFFRSEQEAEENLRWDKPFEDTPKSYVALYFVHFLSPYFLTWGLLAGIIIAGVLVSMSRGACVAIAVALCLSFLAVFSTRRLKWSLIAFALIGLLGTGLVFWIGMDENVQKRLETMTSGDDTFRSLNWSNAVKTAGDFHWRGTGFGTYQYANLLNDEMAAKNRICVRAENQYVEIFLDLGIWGLVLFLVCLVIIFVLCCRFIRQRNDDCLTAFGGGFLVAVITQAVASIFDFGLYIVANALMFAVCCGILSATICPLHKDSDHSFPKELHWFGYIHKSGLLMTGCLFLVLLVQGQEEIRKIHRIDSVLNHLIAIKDNRTVPLEELTAVLSQLEIALQSRPDDAMASEFMAEGQICMFRRTLYNDLLVELPDRSPEELWGMTSLEVVHASLWRLRRIGITGRPLQAIRETTAVDVFLRPAFINLVRSRQSNPMFIGTHYLIAELIPILDKHDVMREYEQQTIERMTKVAPYSTVAWYKSGVLERNIGNSKQARANWKQSLSLSHRYLGPIALLTREDMRGDNSEALFQTTFPNSPEVFLILVTKYFTKNNAPDFYETALSRFFESCKTATNISEGERHYYLGRYSMLTDQYESAITEFTAACKTQRSNHEWRYHLANAYFKNRQYKEAQREIEMALFFSPENRTYLNLKDKLLKL